MKPYRNHKTIQARGHGGQFRQWELNRDFGCCECPWCHTLSAHRPAFTGQRFIDPADFARRVCSRCGWDSAAKHGVSIRDAVATWERYENASSELALSYAVGDPLAIEICRYQERRERRQSHEWAWFRRNDS